MSKPWIHAQSSARKFGGEAEEYVEIHSFIDSSKGAIPTNVHRALTHTSWFLSTILERIKFANSYPAPNNTFPTIVLKSGKHVSVRDIGEQHILEDFKHKFIPTAQDYLQEIEFKEWMQNGNGYPPSFQKLSEQDKKKPKKVKTIPLTTPLTTLADVIVDGVQHPLLTNPEPEPVTYDGGPKFQDRLLD